MGGYNTRWALRDVDGQRVRPPRHPANNLAFEDPEWQASHRVLAAMQARGCVLDEATVRVVCALVREWPPVSERRRA